MRPTLLDHRPVDERTAEHFDVAITRDGHRLNICDEKYQNSKGYSLPQAPRFGLMNFHDKGTGQTIFCSSNSYNAGAQAAKLLAKPAPFITVSFKLVDSFSEINFSFRSPRDRQRPLDHDWPPNKIRAGLCFERTEEDYGIA